MQFHGKQAYPAYLTISNILKQIWWKPSWQGQVLLAYLPISKLGHITNKSSHCCCMSNLFHHCMQTIIKPLEHAGHEGIILISGDGAMRKCFPILAAYIGDYPEQILVLLVKTGTCPICPALQNDIGNWDSILEPRYAQKITKSLNAIDKGAAKFTKAHVNAGIKPVQCVFWKNLPYIDIYHSITPDILHQLYQGLLKHLIGWIWAACGDAEVDARCHHLPPNHHIWLFMKGISHLSCVTGTEHDQISRFLLALVADVHLPDGHSNAQLVYMYSLYSPQFHLSTQIPYSHIWNTCSNEWHSSCIPPKLWYSCFSQHPHPFQHSKASQFWSLLQTYSALWHSWQF